MDKILILTNSHAYEEGLSGGERIAIELYRRWHKKCQIYVYTSNFGKFTWEKCGINTCCNFYFPSIIKKNRNMLFSYVELAFSYLKRIFDVLSCKDFKEKIKLGCWLYSASDFWPDSIPAFIMKIVNKNTKWVAGFYLFAPKPWQKDSAYKGKKWFVGFFYWLTQVPIYWIVREYADMVFVTSEPDVGKFLTNRRGRDKIIVVRGGVDIKPSVEFLDFAKFISVKDRRYSACFVGRFHYQKGVLELIDIWKNVQIRKPGVKLAIIGIGPLEKEVKERIEKRNLSDCIELLGFKDGKEKYKIFKQSNIIVHPATYDSGGMAACEAMAWGLPGVSFDLEALKTYYPKGMIKTPCYDLEMFAENIISLLEDKELYKRMSKEAIDWAREWDWDLRAEKILRSMKLKMVKK